MTPSDVQHSEKAHVKQKLEINTLLYAKTVTRIAYNKQRLHLSLVPKIFKFDKNPTVNGQHPTALKQTLNLDVA